MLTKILHAKFLHPTTAQVLHLASFVLALANIPLTIGATLTGVPAWLNWLTPLWPGIFAVAFGLSRFASAFSINPDSALSTLISQGLITAQQVAATLKTTKP